MLSWILGIVTTLVGGFLSALVWRLYTENRELRKTIKENEHKKNDAIMNGIKCLLRAELIAKHKIYTERGYISVHGLEAFTEAYNSYVALGGNGKIKKMYEEIIKLPIKY